MKIAIFKDTCARSGIPVMQAFIDSIKDEDYIICDNNARPEADVVVMWSVLLNMYGRKPIYTHYKNRAKLLIIEVGGLIRNESWRMGIGNINALANFANQSADDARLSKLKLDNPAPWKNGEHVIICTQNVNSDAWTGGNIIDWCNKQVAWIRSQSDRYIYLRTHPRHQVNLSQIANRYKGVYISTPKMTGNGDEVDFASLLNNAHAVVNYNSNPAIEAVLQGVPVYVDESSLCRPVGNLIGSDIENPAKPNRTEWLKQISYCEWFVDEIRQGLPWSRLKEQL